MKNLPAALNIALGVAAAVLAGSFVWQRSMSGPLTARITDIQGDLTKAVSRQQHLERLKSSTELDELERQIVARVPIGDIHALSLAKELKIKVQELGLKNFVFMLGDGSVQGAATGAQPPQRLDIVPVTVTVSFESQFPQIVAFLRYLYDAKRFVNIERLTIARVESSAGAVPVAGQTAVPGMPTGMLSNGIVQPGQATGGMVKNICQKATIVLTAYTFTQ